MAEALDELERDLDSERMRSQLVVALDPASDIRDGSSATIWFDPRRLHIFDPATGENLTGAASSRAGADAATVPSAEPAPTS